MAIGLSGCISTRHYERQYADTTVSYRSFHWGQEETIGALEIDAIDPNHAQYTLDMEGYARQPDPETVRAIRETMAEYLRAMQQQAGTNPPPQSQPQSAPPAPPGLNR